MKGKSVEPLSFNLFAKKDFSKSKPVTTQNVSNDFSKPVTAQILPQNMLPIVKNTNVIAPGMTTETKHAVNKSVATSSKKTVATDSTVKKSRNITKKLYEQLVEIVLFIVDSGCSKHMTGNLKLLTNFVERFLGTVKFGNDQIAPILGYGRAGSRNNYYQKLLSGSLPDLRDLKGNDLPHSWLWRSSSISLPSTPSTWLSKNNIVNVASTAEIVKDHRFDELLPIYFGLTSCGPKTETPEFSLNSTLDQRGLHAQETTVSN
ncbi:hypothetical protein Tco_0452694 [Tanacetum coccineum]